MKVWSLALLIAAIPLAAVAEPKRIAVLEFATPKTEAQAVDRETVVDLTDSARAGALETVRGLPYTVMTKEMVQEILAENAGTCAEDECELELGRSIGADLLITGAMTRTATQFIVTLRLHDVRKSVPLQIRQFTGASWVELRGQMATEARLLIERGLGVDTERLTKGWGSGAAIVGGGGLLLAAGIGGIVYGLQVDRAYARQQPGQPNYFDPTVTRAQADRAKTLYWAGWGASAVGAAVTAFGIRYLVKARASVAFIPAGGGGMAFAAWEF